MNFNLLDHTILLTIEGTVYALSKFCKLAMDGNPNILDVLFCRNSEDASMNDQAFWHLCKLAEQVQCTHLL